MTKVSRMTLRVDLSGVQREVVKGGNYFVVVSFEEYSRKQNP